MAYRDYEKKTFDAWDIDDDNNKEKINSGCSDGELFGYTSIPLPISVADSDAVAQQIIKSHQEKLKTTPSLDSNPSPTIGSIQPKGPGNILTLIPSNLNNIFKFDKSLSFGKQKIQIFVFHSSIEKSRFLIGI